MHAETPNQVETPPIKTCCLLARPAADFLMWYRELAKIDGVDLEPGANASMVESDKQGFIFVDEDCLENLAPYEGDFWFYALTPLEYKDKAYVLKQKMDPPGKSKQKGELGAKERGLPRWTGGDLDKRFWATEWKQFKQG